MIYFRCSCGKELKVPDSLARKVVTCNQCSRRNIQLPGAGERLDLSDYELEDIDKGTIVLEAPSAQSNLVQRKPIKKQPAAVSEPRPRRLPRREERPEPEPEPEEEFEDEPARPARPTRRLQEKKPEAPARAERPSRRGSSRKKERTETPVETSSLKAHSSQIKLQAISKLVEELKSEDEQDTVDEVQAARKGRSGRGSGRGSGSKNKRGREADDDDDIRDYGSSQKFLYVIIGAIVLVAIALFFYFKEPSQKKQAPVVTQPVVDTTKPPEKVAPKVEAPKYEKITEEGNNLLTLFNITGENKDTIVAALEEKRKSAVTRKMSSKSYDTYIQEILKKKLAYVFAIHYALETIKFENEDHKQVLCTLASLINSSSNINKDKDLMKPFPVDFNAAKITIEKDKLIEFLDKTKKEFDDGFAKVEIIKTPMDWKLVVDIVANGKVEDDTTDIQIQPQ